MNLKNHFLIAMPNMQDERFSNSVIYICEHSSKGAMGLVVNQPVNISVANMLEQIEIERTSFINFPIVLEQPVLNGGPVSEDKGFVLHRHHRTYDSSVQLSEDITITTSRDILSILGTHEAPNHFLVALGYSGWGAGQLEQEIAQNAWLTLEANADILFETPLAERREKALALLGINPLHLSSTAGHA